MKTVKAVSGVTIQLPEWDMLPDIGLYMDQIITLMDRVFLVRMPKGELTKPMINNYVKAGLLPRPTGKKYDRDHLAIILMIYVLKQVLNMDSIGTILKRICEKGVRSGYELFRKRLDEMEHALRTGNVKMNWTDDSREELMFRLALTAALCTIRTYWLLSEQTEPET